MTDAERNKLHGDIMVAMYEGDGIPHTRPLDQMDERSVKAYSMRAWIAIRMCEERLVRPDAQASARTVEPGTPRDSSAPVGQSDGQPSSPFDDEPDLDGCDIAAAEPGLTVKDVLADDDAELDGQIPF